MIMISSKTFNWIKETFKTIAMLAALISSQSSFVSVASQETSYLYEHASIAKIKLLHEIMLYNN